MKIRIGQTSDGKPFNIDFNIFMRSKLLVVANSGGGKSYMLRKIIEQTYEYAQQFIFDPEGEFGTLREKLGFILVGKDGDIQPDIKSARMLAIRLLEMRVSAIFDLYDMQYFDRIRYVQEFVDGAINAPKHLWHKVNFFVDETQIFLPESGEKKHSQRSVGDSAIAVLDLAVRGRKRGFNAIFSTQRPSEMRKTAIAMCNNKLIGMTTLPADVKEVAVQLGMKYKDAIPQLRNLDYEFFAFGRAISKDVIQVKADTTATSHFDIDKKNLRKKVVPPSDDIRKVLQKLADIPQKAEEEAQTIASMKTEIHRLKMELRTKSQPVVQAPVVEKAIPIVDQAAVEMNKRLKHRVEQLIKLTSETANSILHLVSVSDDGEKIVREEINAALDAIRAKLARREQQRELTNVRTKAVQALNVLKELAVVEKTLMAKTAPISRSVGREQLPSTFRIERAMLPATSRLMAAADVQGVLPIGEKRCLIAIAQHGEEGVMRDQLSVLTSYKVSSRNTYMFKLLAKGFIRSDDEMIFKATSEGIAALGNDFELLPTGKELIDHWMNILPVGEKAVLKVVIAAYPNGVTRDAISEETKYKPSSRNTYIFKLAARKVVIVSKDKIWAAERLFT